MASKIDDIQFLVDSGWSLAEGRSPWSWHHYSIPAAYYTLADALSLQRSNNRPAKAISKPVQR